MENIAFFLGFAGKYIGTHELFQTVDLYEVSGLHLPVSVQPSCIAEPLSTFSPRIRTPSSRASARCRESPSRRSASRALVQRLFVLSPHYPTGVDNFIIAFIQESEAEKRNWTEEQLRSGDSIIGLQMGSNKGASQSGMIMGNTRHM